MSIFSVSNENGIAVVTLDMPGEPVNKLNAAAKREFEALLSRLRDEPAVRAVVLLSGKPENFIASADIEEFTQIRTQDEATALSREGQEMIDRVEAFSKPIVAAIHGACLGGGLELALACHWRVATDHPKTRLGLPEVQLGLLPGAGGCQRLPRLIGLRAALDIILAGKTERAGKAKRLGLVDELVAPPILREVAIRAADRLAHEGLPQRRPPGGATGWLLERTRPGRALIFWLARRNVLKKTGGHYPAPLAALEAVRAGLEAKDRSGFVTEHRKFGELAVTDVSRKLVGLFFATTALKKDDFGTAGATPRPVDRIGVVGSGFMGAGIAGTAVSEAEVEARLKDAELPRVGKGLKGAIGILDGRLKRRQITKYEHQRVAALLSGSTDWSGFRHADLVLEAVFEDLELKRQILSESETSAPSAIFATNTSTIPIAQIAERAARPERVLGMHFFSPVDRMPLLEIIPTDRTSPETLATAVQFGRRMGKVVIVVKDHPGFWVNRILTPYLNEANRLLSEGTGIELIDRTMTRFGFPVGPVALLDEVGLDVASKAGKVMHHAFGARLEPVDVVSTMIADNRYGRKNGRGFYHYHEGHKTGVDDTVYDLLGVRPGQRYASDVIEDRLVYAMLNEAALAVSDGVVRSPRDGDIGAIFGIGFPPFRGGPLRMLDDLGVGKVVERLTDLAAAFGERFRPAPALVEMARTGGRYYPR